MNRHIKPEQIIKAMQNLLRDLDRDVQRTYDALKPYIMHNEPDMALYKNYDRAYGRYEGAVEMQEMILKMMGV